MKSKRVLLVPIFYLTFSYAGPRERHGPLDFRCTVFICAVNVVSDGIQICRFPFCFVHVLRRPRGQTKATRGTRMVPWI